MIRPEADEISTQFVAIIRAEMEVQGLSVRAFAKRCGVDQANMNTTLNRPGVLKSSTMCLYLKHLGLAPVLTVRRLDGA